MNGYELYILNSSLKCRCDFEGDGLNGLSFGNDYLKVDSYVYVIILRSFLKDFK